MIILCYNSFMELLELEISIPNINGIDLTMYEYIPEFPKDVIPEIVYENVRLFNNSCLCLYDFYKIFSENYEKVKKEKWDSQNNRRIRQYISLLYKELFVYQEKLVNFVIQLLHKKIKTKNTKQSLCIILEVGQKLQFIKQFYSIVNNLYQQGNYQRFLKIRDDEVHNISWTDNVCSDLKIINGELKIVPIKYKYDLKLFYDNINYVIAELIKIKRYIESFLTNDNISLINNICKITK